MSFRSLLTVCIAVCVHCGIATFAYSIGPRGEPEERCGQICGSASCDADCIWNGSWTKCAIYNGNPANDYDSDGISNSSDNCQCSSNADQADCDGDGRGDVCDGQNVKWVRTAQGSNICYADKDTHVGTYEIEAFSRDIWTNVCNNATCVKNVEKGSNACTINLPTMQCCYSLMDYLGVSRLPCFYINVDNCGTPKCPF